MMALARGLDPRFVHVNSVPRSPGWLSQNKLGGPPGNRSPSFALQERRAPVIINGPWCAIQVRARLSASSAQQLSWRQSGIRSRSPRWIALAHRNGFHEAGR